MITLIFPTAGDLADFFRDPAHEKTLNADVADFADVAAINISLGDELVIVEDGKLKAWTPYVFRDEDDWTAVTDVNDRKKIQNRLAQRARRANLKSRRAATSKDPVPSRGTDSAHSDAGDSHESAPVQVDVGSTSQRASMILDADGWSFSGSGQRDDATPTRLAEEAPLDFTLSNIDPNFIILTPTATVTAYISNASLLQLSCSSPSDRRIFHPRHLSVPPPLAPTALQKSIPHPSFIDILPFPGLRNRLLRSLHAIDLAVLSQDLVQDAFQVWGRVTWDGSGWEVSEAFARRWWFLIDEELLRATNFWRRQKFEGALLIGEDGEVSVVT
ncbi:uncharacterized protein N7459_001236 [Penicillium hispanicum]|uniref:uncharacterized protein n=1 Tax=Penicillium hispanicum TaxID=1080232 RepID=UPI00253F980E|nr:uncharacterized protein N7459_001236 [Penicillium hispanicum]KAJ5595028.1 hypothetical protein N7459_001236 [Penicillium hispanicum]